MEYVQEIRGKFLDFFLRNGHHLVPDRGLIPGPDDPSSLFINSGVQAIKPYIVGAREPPANKLTSSQSCLRTIDIDRVGQNARTLTYFNMLGSWSIGDYWKDRALELAYQLLTDDFGLASSKFAITVFEGDSSIPADEESVKIWQSLGIQPHQIYRKPASDNLWSMGDVGPCGPCTEVYIDRGKEFGPNAVPGDESPRFVEIWNAGVFMTYIRQPDGRLDLLVPRVVDTGAGLERLAVILQNKPTVYDIFPLDQLSEIAKAHATRTDYSSSSVHVISDHLRASTYLADEGIVPSNKLQGYTLRRLLRRAIYNAALLGVNDFEGMLKDTLYVLGGEKKIANERFAYEVFLREHNTFQRTLAKGRAELDKLISSSSELPIPGTQVFHLYETFGFPIELTQEILAQRGKSFDMAGFEQAREEHRLASKTLSGKVFRQRLEGLVNPPKS